MRITFARAPEVHHAARRRGGGVAAPDARAKIGNANGASAERDCSLDDHQRPS
jgi:hypothetical protein